MDLKSFCGRFQALLAKSPGDFTWLEEGRGLLGELLRDPAWLGDFLRAHAASPAFLSEKPASVFDNEIRICRGPEGSFTLLAYIWDGPAPCPVHDHSSWGLIGPVLRPLREIKYRRLDDGAVEGFAEVEPMSDSVLMPGEAGVVLPLNKGIHQTGSANGRLTLSLGLYGRSLRPGYIHFFAPEERKIRRAYPPRPFRKVLALRALRSLGKALGRELLSSRLLQSLPASLVREFQAASPGSDRE